MRIGQVLTINKDGIVSIKDNETYSIAGVQCYGQGVVNRRQIKGSELTMKKYQIIKPNQLMWCKVDTKNGAFGVTKTEHSGLLASPNMCLANIDTKKIIPELLQKLFQFSFFYKNITSKSTGTTNRQYLTPAEFLEKIEIPDWKLDEQEIILRRINSIKKKNLNDKVCLLEKNFNLIKGLILNKAIQGKLVPQDPNDETAEKLLEKIKIEKEKLVKEGKIKKENLPSFVLAKEIPFELPKGWKWSRAEDFCTQITDGTHHTPTYVQSGIPFLSVKDLTGGKLEFSNSKFISEDEHRELSKRCHPEFNNVLLTKVGTTGIARIVNTKEEFSIFVSLSLLKFNSDFINPHYLELCINSPYVRKLSKDGTEGIGNKNLVLRKIKSFLIPIPPINEQKRIVEKVHSLMKICDVQEKNINDAKGNIDKLNQAILREMFN